MQINSFQYYLPVNLIFGPGKTEVLGEEAARYGKKVMIVTGRRSTKRSGLLDRAKSLLEKAGTEVGFNFSPSGREVIQRGCSKQ